MNSSKMYIHLFDGFTIEYGGEVFNMRDYLSRQSLSLLEVLILQDQNNVSRDFLMELFWENSDNPLSSLPIRRDFIIFPAQPIRCCSIPKE